MPLVYFTPYNEKTNIVRVTQFDVTLAESSDAPVYVSQIDIGLSERSDAPIYATQFDVGVVEQMNETVLLTQFDVGVVEQMNETVLLTQFDIGVIDKLTDSYPENVTEYTYTFRADAHPMNGHIGYFGDYGELSPNDVYGETVAGLTNTPNNKTMLALWGTGHPQNLFLVMILDNKLYYASNATYDPAADLAGIGAGLGTSWTWNVDSNLVGNTYYPLIIV